MPKALLGIAARMPRLSISAQLEASDACSKTLEDAQCCFGFPHLAIVLHKEVDLCRQVIRGWVPGWHDVISRAPRGAAGALAGAPGLRRICSERLGQQVFANEGGLVGELIDQGPTADIASLMHYYSGEKRELSTHARAAAPEASLCHASLAGA